VQEARIGIQDGNAEGQDKADLAGQDKAGLAGQGNAGLAGLDKARPNPAGARQAGK